MNLSMQSASDNAQSLWNERIRLKNTSLSYARRDSSTGSRMFFSTRFEYKAQLTVLFSLLQTFSRSGQRNLTKGVKDFNFDKDYIC